MRFTLLHSFVQEGSLAAEWLDEIEAPYIGVPYQTDLDKQSKIRILLLHFWQGQRNQPFAQHLIFTQVILQIDTLLVLGGG